jgi:hypothetical protein
MEVEGVESTSSKENKRKTNNSIRVGVTNPWKDNNNNNNNNSDSNRDSDNSNNDDKVNSNNNNK